MREKAINIGHPVSLAGVLTEPARLDPDKPIFIVLNSGVMHHVGACRLSVKLAREMAQQAGMLALRFDFSGIGDSDSRGHQQSLEQRTQDELREVIDYITSKFGVHRVILCGLCSGAHNGFTAALTDERVVGLVQYDGHCYPTWKSYLYFYRPRILKWKHWRSLMRRATARLSFTPTTTAQNSSDIADLRFIEQPLFAPKPPKVYMEAGLRDLVQRRVRLLCMFTGADHLDFMYREQYADCFRSVDFGQLLRVEHLPDATHIVTEPSYQLRLIQRTLDWAKTV